MPWNLAEADDIDVWWSQWKDLFFAAVKDSVAAGSLVPKEDELTI